MKHIKERIEAGIWEILTQSHLSNLFCISSDKAWLHYLKLLLAMSLIQHLINSVIHPVK